MNRLLHARRKTLSLIGFPLFVSVVSLLAACQNGISFSKNSKISENTLLPPTIESSIPAGIYRHDLNLLTGMLAIQNRDGGITTYLRAVDKPPLVTIIPDDKKLIYQSIISAKGNALLRATGVETSVTGTQIAELIINQNEFSALNELPLQKIKEEAKKIHPHADQKVVYIAAATLYSIKTTIFDQIESNATVEYGPIIGVNGKAYKSSNSIRNDYAIYLNLVDVDVLTNISAEDTVNFSTTQAKFVTLPGVTAPQPSVLATDTDLSEAIPPQPVSVDAPPAPSVAPIKFQATQHYIKLSD